MNFHEAFFDELVKVANSFDINVGDEVWDIHPKMPADDHLRNGRKRQIPGYVHRDANLSVWLDKNPTRFKKIHTAHKKYFDSDFNTKFNWHPAYRLPKSKLDDSVEESRPSLFARLKRRLLNLDIFSA